MPLDACFEDATSDDRGPANTPGTMRMRDAMAATRCRVQGATKGGHAASGNIRSAPRPAWVADFATRSTRAWRADARGFTLIEIMIALVITLIALEVLFGGVVNSLRVARSTAVWDRVISRAESRLASISDPALVLGERQGDDGDGYRWRSNVTFLGAAPAPRAERPGPWSRGTGLYAVSVTILWREGSGERRFELNSARLGFVPDAGS